MDWQPQYIQYNVRKLTSHVKIVLQLRPESSSLMYWALSPENIINSRNSNISSERCTKATTSTQTVKREMNPETWPNTKS